MRRTISAALVITCAGTLGWMASGCGSVSPTDTIAQAVGKIDIFNQLTVGDVIEGFQQFRNSFGRHGPALTADQRSQIDALQAQLDAGTITQEDFQTKVQAIVGDSAPGIAFGGFGFYGSPVGGHAGFQHADPLSLTDEQQTQAREIFEKAHDDIDQLRIDAKASIYNVLTDEQKAKLAELQAQAPLGAFLGNARGGRHGGFGGGFGGERAADRLTRQLGITEEQQKSIDQIRTDLRAAVKARHDLAREEFRAILTPEQLATLDAIEARIDAVRDRFLGISDASNG